MLSSIYLQNNLLLKANKVHKIATEILLAAEFGELETAVSELVPEEIFGFGLICSEGAGTLNVHGRTPFGRGDFETREEFVVEGKCEGSE